MRKKWELFCLKLRYLMRDPWDVVENRALARRIDEMEEG